MPAPLFDLTAHAATVIAEREIEVAWLELALKNPERIEPDRFDSSLEHALARIPQRGDRVLRVVYNPSHTPPKVVTAYFDRRQRGKP
jgi:hypothetical protein